MAIHEECGVFGVIAPEARNVASLCHYGLYALQHRGQESCGIVVNDRGVFSSHKDLGLVSEVFTPQVMQAFPQGTMAVAHARYGTTGGTNRKNCQPIEVNHRKGKLALAHNGNLSNAADLRDALELSGAIFHTTADTETIAYIITRERLIAPSIEVAVSRAMDVLDGAYSIVLMSATKLICARDPRGFRPLCFGVTDDGTYVVASETCALVAVGATLVRDVEPGEIVIFSREAGADGYSIQIETRTEHCGKRDRHLCVFEYIYFARPDSVIDGVSVHAARYRAGEILAAKNPVEADIVMGVPDSGLDAALGYSKASGIPYDVGFLKNKYIGRTFIAPGDRLDMVKIKLQPIVDVVRGKRIVLIDDSIVRGNTSGRIVRLLREAGATEVHLRISAPPFTHPCYYGTDIDSQENLIACKMTIPQIAEFVGADSLEYLSVEDLLRMVGCSGLCDACFTGAYPTSVPQAGCKNRFEQYLEE